MNKVEIVLRHCWDHSRRAIGRRRHHAPAGSIFFIHRHRIHRHPVKRRQRVDDTHPILRLSAKTLCQPHCASTHLQAAGQNTLRRHAAFHAAEHHFPDRKNVLLHAQLSSFFITPASSTLVAHHQFTD